MKHQVLTLASSLLLLAGCAMGPQAIPAGSGASLALTPEVVSGGYRTQAPASVEPYSQADITHITAMLYTVSAGVEAPVEQHGVPVTRVIPNADLGKPVVFDRLRPDTTYRVKCQAYMVEPALTRLISTDDADSTTDIVVTNDDRPTVGKLKVKLKARPFSGEGSFDLDVKDGKLLGGGSETLTDKGAAN